MGSDPLTCSRPYLTVSCQVQKPGNFKRGVGLRKKGGNAVTGGSSTGQSGDRRRIAPKGGAAVIGASSTGQSGDRRRIATKGGAMLASHRFAEHERKRIHGAKR